MTETGIDVSMFQSASTLASWLPKITFAIVKASEGRSYVDPTHDSHVATLRGAGKKVGHYHYAWPGSNSPEDEFAAFWAAAKAQPGDVLALDYENFGSSATNPADWVVRWVTAAHAKTGVWPGIYLTDYWAGIVLAKATPAQVKTLRNCWLWKAGNHDAYVSDPSQPVGSTFGWDLAHVWQWQSKPLDQNVAHANVWTNPQGVFMALTDAQQLDLYNTVKSIAGDASGLRSEESGRYPYYAGKFNAILDALNVLTAAVKAGKTDPEALAAAIVAALPPGSPTDLATVEAGVRAVLGGLDNIPAAS